jgi:hypothetical protein
VAVTGLVLLLDLRSRGIVVEAHGDRLRLVPADRLTAADRVVLLNRKFEVLGLLRDLESLEADGTAQLWRQVYENLPQRDRERLADEVREGDPLALCLALCLDAPRSVLEATRRGAA